MTKKALINILILSQLANCAPAIIGATTAGAGVVLIQDRTLGDAIDDSSIFIKIKSEYFQNNKNNIFSNINIKVNEGRVLLTGDTYDQEALEEAVRIAWSQRGVKEVINEIRISSKEKASLKDYSIDSLITSQIKARMLLNKRIDSVNYKVETLNRTVYLFGIAKSQEELDEVSDIASTTEYVQHVISHVKIRGEGDNE